MTKGQNNAPAVEPPDGSGGAAPNTQGDLRASNSATEAFNHFTSTIESVVAAALAQAGMTMVVNPMAETGMNPADRALLVMQSLFARWLPDFLDPKGT